MTRVEGVLLVCLLVASVHAADDSSLFSRDESTFTNMTSPHADAYRRGVCDAMEAAQTASRRNWEHWRALLGIPTRTLQDVLDGLYATPRRWSYDATDSLARQSAIIAADSAALYVVLPQQRAKAVYRVDGREIVCEESPKKP